MSDEIDPELAVEAILLHVADLNGSSGTGGTEWLTGEFRRVLTAFMEGDIFVAATSFEGSSANSQSRVPAKTLLAILTQCRKRLTGGGSSDHDGAMLIPRFAQLEL